MMNKARFHNSLALALGYEHIVNDKRFNIIVDEKDDELRVIMDIDGRDILSFNAVEVDEIKTRFEKMNNDIYKDDLKLIVNAVHQTYTNATNNLF